MAKENKARCEICECVLYSGKGKYGEPTPEGRAHLSRHHYIAERFFGRSKNRKGTRRPEIFTNSPWPASEGQAALCYDCHEELLHNPVILKPELEKLSALVKKRRLSERIKTESRAGIAGRIKLLQEIIKKGLENVQ